MKKQMKKQGNVMIRRAFLSVLIICILGMLIYLLFHDDVQYLHTSYIVSLLLCILLFLTSVILAGSVYWSSSSLYQRPDLSEYVHHVLSSIWKNLKDF